MVSFYSTRQHPRIKQVHSRPHTIILIKTKVLRQHFFIGICKQINTTNGIANLHTHCCVVQKISTRNYEE
ncbi:hypothetical protein FDK33_09155 [Citrobacter werkmanii]|nr:hypothetical protein [Citrobacter werkmanii]MBQ4936109.1 hypothetical protein [Citrobacter werkmanii]MBQ4948213.1 hypothetical protein [Citrobacter werkmanii]MBQ4964607.1 hypothetical protein [Citrobacter werkmanii]